MPSSFFKILLDPSACNLSIPPDYISKHFNNKIPNFPTIQSENGEYSWKLQIKQIDDGYCFTDGWNSVVQDTNLDFGDFLLFQPVDQYTFKLSIYTPDGCEKILPPKIGGDRGVEKAVSGEFDTLPPKTGGDGGVEKAVSGEFDTLPPNTGGDGGVEKAVSGEFNTLTPKTGGDGGVEKAVTGEFDTLPPKTGGDSGVEKAVSGEFDTLPTKTEGDGGVEKAVSGEFDTLPPKTGGDGGVEKDVSGEFDTLPTKTGGDGGVEKAVAGEFDTLPPKTGGDGGLVEKAFSGEFENLAGEDDNDDDDDDDPFFKAIIAGPRTKFLRFPAGFSESAGISEEGSMPVKNLDGKEWITSLKLDKSFRITKRFLLSAGWPRCRRQNGVSEGDECVFRFIRSEGKLLLAKVTKNKHPARHSSTSREVPVKKVVKRAKQPSTSGEVPVKKAVKRARGRQESEHDGDVDVGPAEMPTKRQCGSPHHNGTCVKVESLEFKSLRHF